MGGFVSPAVVINADDEIKQLVQVTEYGRGVSRTKPDLSDQQDSLLLAGRLSKQRAKSRERMKAISPVFG